MVFRIFLSDIPKRSKYKYNNIILITQKLCLHKPQFIFMHRVLRSSLSNIDKKRVILVNFVIQDDSKFNLAICKSIWKFVQVSSGEL